MKLFAQCFLIFLFISGFLEDIKKYSKGYSIREKLGKAYNEKITFYILYFMELFALISVVIMFIIAYPQSSEYSHPFLICLRLSLIFYTVFCCFIHLLQIIFDKVDVKKGDKWYLVRSILQIVFEMSAIFLGGFASEIFKINFV